MYRGVILFLFLLETKPVVKYMSESKQANYICFLLYIFCLQLNAIEIYVYAIGFQLFHSCDFIFCFRFLTGIRIYLKDKFIDNF